MAGRTYREFFISIQAVSGSENHNPIARISSAEGGGALTCLYCPSEFPTYEESEQYCFRMAEKWIDDYIASSAEEKSAGVIEPDLNTPQNL
jgi:hypothetical protein